MLESELLGSPENKPEPITRPKMKRLILEYLQKISRQEVLKESLDERDEELDARYS